MKGTSPHPIPKAELIVERLATAIITAVTDSTMQQRAQEIGAAIRAEDGVHQAVKFVHHCVAGFHQQKTQSVLIA